MSSSGGTASGTISGASAAKTSKRASHDSAHAAHHADDATRKRVTAALDPLMPDFTWPMLQVQAASQSLESIEQQLRSGALDEGAAALKLVADSAAELKACYAFIDQLEESVNSAGLLVEATERRLEVLERGERLPASLASLPPPMFTNHQFTRQIRRRERTAPPDLPELSLLPRSRSASSPMAWASRESLSRGGSGSTSRKSGSFADGFAAATVELFKEANSPCINRSSRSSASRGGGGGRLGATCTPSTSDPFGDAYSSGGTAASQEREEMERDLAELKLKVSAAAAAATEKAKSRAQELIGGLSSWFGS
jgi:hypothetical protein